MAAEDLPRPADGQPKPSFRLADLTAFRMFGGKKPPHPARPRTTAPPRPAPAPLVTASDPKSPAAEAYRTLRTNIQFAGLDQPCRTILITSATLNEGKTTTVANFGVVAAMGGVRVCLIDSDLRRPSLHRLFDLANSRGLTNALVDGLPFAEVTQSTRVPNLSVLTSGPLPPNPAELVGSRRMHDFLDSGASEFDLLILDSPPAIAVSDAIVLSAQCDGTLLVIRSGAISPELARRTAEQIAAVKGRILGVLLNGVDFRRDGYYSDYYRSYTAYYGARPAE